MPLLVYSQDIITVYEPIGRPTLAASVGHASTATNAATDTALGAATDTATNTAANTATFQMGNRMPSFAEVSNLEKELTTLNQVSSV